MKQVVCALFLIFALSPSLPANAQDQDADGTLAVPTDPALDKGDLWEPPAESADERRAQRLDLMFARLAKTTDERRANRIARHIMRRLNQSGSDTTDFLMARAAEAMRDKDLPLALDLLDGVVRLQPDFAEGWNRRATVYFLLGDYGSSMADIEQVLIREPRHWGALAGLAMILMSLDRKEEALTVMDRALDVHPYLERMKERRDRLAKEIEGADI